MEKLDFNQYRFIVTYTINDDEIRDGLRSTITKDLHGENIDESTYGIVNNSTNELLDVISKYLHSVTEEKFADTDFVKILTPQKQSGKEQVGCKISEVVVLNNKKILSKDAIKELFRMHELMHYEYGNK